MALAVQRKRVLAGPAVADEGGQRHEEDGDNGKAPVAWLMEEAALNRTALRRGCVALWVCLLVGFTPFLWAVVGGASLLVGDTMGWTTLASVPLAATTSISSGKDMWGEMSLEALRSLRREAVQFVVSHPGVSIVAKPPPEAGMSRRPFQPSPTGTKHTSTDAAVPKQDEQEDPLLADPYAAESSESKREHHAVFDDIEYRPLGVLSLDDDAVVPRLVHQTWKQNDQVPQRWKAAHETWLRAHTAGQPFTVLLWSDQALHDFVLQLFPWFVPTYNGYAAHIQRVDAARYFILYALGGVYADLDVALRPVPAWDEVLRAEVTLPRTAPLGVSNDLMAAAPNHPFMAHLCRRLVSPLAAPGWLYTRFFTVMFSTGPSFVSLQLDAYTRQRNALQKPFAALPSRPGLQGLLLLDDRLYGGGHDSLVGHVPGRSWHDTPTAILWGIFSALPDPVALPGVIIIVTLAIVAAVVSVVIALGWGPCCMRREARALLCCVAGGVGMLSCFGPPHRPCCCPCLAEPVRNPPDHCRKS